MFRVKECLIVCLFAMSLLSVCEAQENTGNTGMPDLKKSPPTCTDAKGDVSENDIVDFTNVWMLKIDNDYYFCYSCSKPVDWQGNAWRYNIFVDTDNNPDTGYKGFDGNWALGVEYMVQGPTLFSFAGTGPTAWEWKKMTEVQLKTSLSGNTAIIKVPATLFEGKPVEIKAIFQGDNQSEKNYITDFVPDNYTQKALSCSRPETK